MIDLTEYNPEFEAEVKNEDKEEDEVQIQTFYSSSEREFGIDWSIKVDLPLTDKKEKCFGMFLNADCIGSQRTQLVDFQIKINKSIFF